MTLLFPKKVKYREWQKMRKSPDKMGKATRGNYLTFGSFGLKAMTPARITSNQIEAARKVISRKSGKSAKLWIRIFPDRSYTSKGAEVPMGKGKGDIEGYEIQVKPGRVLFEVDGVSAKVANEALRVASSKLPMKTKIVSRD